MSGKQPKSNPTNSENVPAIAGIKERGAMMEGGSNQIVLDTPQQDSDWSEAKKLEWLKNSSAKLLKIFNQP
jgi:hypothetical protein